MTRNDQEQISEVKTETVLVFDLVRDVELGRIRIPDFHRDFVWQCDQIIDLLDSVRRQFPIGTFLLWETDAQQGGKEWVGPVRIPFLQSGKVGLVLDGQQRLSTLVGALCLPKSNETNEIIDRTLWNIFYNLINEVFEYLAPGHVQELYHLPVGVIRDTIPFQKACQRMMRDDGGQGQLYVTRAQALVHSFHSFKIPVVYLRNTSRSTAVEIFDRLNTRGSPLIQIGSLH